MVKIGGAIRLTHGVLLDLKYTQNTQQPYTLAQNQSVLLDWTEYKQCCTLAECIAGLQIYKATIYTCCKTGLEIHKTVAMHTC